MELWFIQAKLCILKYLTEYFKLYPIVSDSLLFSKVLLHFSPVPGCLIDRNFYISQKFSEASALLL